MFKKLIVKYLLGTHGRKLLINVLEDLSKKTDNTIDDKLVAAVAFALEGKDYGLQRKPTGPRTNKRVVASAKTKKA